MSDVDIGIITNVELSLMDLGSLTAELESALRKAVDAVKLYDLLEQVEDMSEFAHGCEQYLQP